MRLHSWEGAHHLWPVVVISVLLSHTTAQQLADRKRYYYIAAVNIDWDYTSNGPDRSAPIYKKVVFREYEEGFKQAKTHPSWLGLLGPTIRGQVGETIVVTFRNKADRPFSLHAHGINYGKQSEGSLYFDNTSQFEKEDDAVPPGGEHTYYWEVTSAVAPQASDPSCLTYTYLSHFDFVNDYNSGLIGTILICKAGSLDESGKQIFFHQEYVFLMGVFDEDKSWYKPKTDTANATRSQIKYTINGYTNGSVPGLSVCTHTSVSLHLVGMSSEPDLFSVHINGQVLQHKGHRVSSVGLIAGTAASANMTAVHTGRWLLSSHTGKHLDAGMLGFVEVRTCQGFDAPKRRLTIKEKRESQEWTYYIAAEEVVWDYAPNMPELIDGDYKLEYLTQGPERIGKKYKKAVYTQYTSAAFTERAENKQRKKELGIIGPVIRAQIRDVIKIVFKNMATRPYSIYPHGLTIDKAAEGVNYPAGGNQSHGVEPGETHTYVWHVIEEDEPLAGDSQCVTRMYHSAVNTPRDIASGLVGPLLICKSQSLSKRNVQLKSDKEQHAMFAVFDENKSWYLGDNIATYSEHAKVNKDDPEFYKSNVMHTINGYVFESGQPLGFCNGEIVTWHVSSVGAQDYIQTATFYGHPFNLNDRSEDFLSLFPMTGETITMNMDNLGIWLLASLSSHDTTKGMRVKFRDVECFRDYVYQYEYDISPDAIMPKIKEEFDIWKPEDIDTIKEEKHVEEVKEKDEVFEVDDYTEHLAQLLNLRSIKNSTNETDVEELDLQTLLNYDTVSGSDLAGDPNKNKNSLSSSIAPTHTSLAKKETINMSLAGNEMNNTSLAGRDTANTSLAGRDTANTSLAEREATDERDFMKNTTLNNSITEALSLNIVPLDSSLNSSLKYANKTEDQTDLNISSSLADGNITSKTNNLTGVPAAETTPGQIKLISDTVGERFIQILDKWTNVNNTSEAEVLVEKTEEIITRGDVFSYSETLHYTSNNTELDRGADSRESATASPSGNGTTSNSSSKVDDQDETVFTAGVRKINSSQLEKQKMTNFDLELEGIGNISLNVSLEKDTTMEQSKEMYGSEAINSPHNSSKGVSQNGSLPLDTGIVYGIVESQNGSLPLDTGIVSGIVESQNGSLPLDTGIVSGIVESQNGSLPLDTGIVSEIVESQNGSLPLDTGIVSGIVESQNGSLPLDTGIVSGIVESQNGSLPLDTGIVSENVESQNGSLPLDTGIVSGIVESQNDSLPLDTGIVSGIVESQNASLPLDTRIVSEIVESQNASLPLDTGIVSGIVESQNGSLPLDTGIVSENMESQNGSLPLDTGIVSENVESQNGSLPLDTGIVSGIVESQNGSLPLDTGIVSENVESQNGSLPLDTGIVSGIVESQNDSLPLDTGIVSGIVESQNASLPLDTGIVSEIVESQNGSLPLDTGIVSGIVESQNCTLSLDTRIVSVIVESQNGSQPLDTGIVSGIVESQNGSLPLDTGIVSGIVESQNGSLPLDTGIVSENVESQNGSLPLDTGIVSGIVESQNVSLPLDTGIVSGIVESQNGSLPLDTGIVSGKVESQNCSLPLDTGIVSGIVESQNGSLPLDSGIVSGIVDSHNGSHPLDTGIVSGIVESQNGTTYISGLNKWNSSGENRSEHKQNATVLDNLLDSSSESISNETFDANPGANNFSLSTNEQLKISSESISQNSVEEVIVYLRNNNSQVIRTTSIDLQEEYWGYEGTHEMVPMEMPDHMTKYIVNGNPEPVTTPETRQTITKVVHRRQKPRKGHAMKTKKKKEYKPQSPREQSISPRGIKPLLNSGLTPRGARPISSEEDFSNKAIVIGVPRPDFSDYELYVPNGSHDGITLKNAADPNGDEYEWVEYIDPYKEKGDLQDLTLDENTKYFLKTAGDNVRVYFITAEEVTWDYGGYGQRRQDKSAEIDRPTQFTKVVFRGYLDSTFSTAQIRGEMDEHLGILGPLIKAEVGQTIMVFFRNLATRSYSLHANGVSYNKQAEGLSYEDESNNWYKYDNEVLPNSSYTYLWKVNANAGPTKDESDCRTWAYYSGVNPEKDINSGLIGPLLVCRKGTLSQKGVNIREFVLLFMTFDESQSWYYKKNHEAREGKNRRARVMLPDSRDKLKFHAINGIIFSLKGLRMYSNQMVRWHLFNLGPPSDLHSVHFHGQTFLNKQIQDHAEAVYPLLPGGFATLEMLPSRPGLWQLESEVGLYQQRGMQTLFLVIDNDCANPLGLMSGSVKDNQITANDRRGNWEPHLARLNNQGKFNAWSTEKSGSWIQVDFQRPVVISHVETQGAKQMFSSHYVVNYTISYSNDKRKWIYYKGESTDFRMTFTGNQEANQVKRNTFFPPLIGRFIRLHPLHFYNSAMVRMEYYGCELDGCSVPLGMESRQIEDYRITASSTASSWYSGVWKASLARLNLQGTVNAWQAKNNNLNQWLQVELRQVMKITGIITQGAKTLGKEMYVISYRLEHSDDGDHWVKYTDDDNCIFKTFIGNTDNNGHVKNYIHPPIFSRFIRIIPLSWKSSITLRIELLGCDFE